MRWLALAASRRSPWFLGAKVVGEIICDAVAAESSSAGRVHAEDWRMSSRESLCSSASER